MQRLNENWITDGLMDFEYKQYILLAYLKAVQESFEAHKLYPPLAEVIAHHRNLIRLKTQKEKMADGFPKKASRLDFKNKQLKYDSMIEDESFMQALQSIIEYAIPKLEHKINEGIDIFETVEQQLEIEPVGLSSIYTKEGYLFLDLDNDPFLNVYGYQLSFFEKENEHFRSLEMTFVQRIRKSIGRTLEHIKVELNKQYKLFSNPSTFRVVSLMPFPFEETLLPVVKRSFVRYLATA